MNSTRRRSRALVAVVLGAQSSLLLFAALKNSPTLDEPAHLVAGLGHWQCGNFSLFKVNPPLARLVASSLAAIEGVELDWRGLHDNFRGRAEFILAENTARRARSRLIGHVAKGRFMLLPFALITVFFCYRWSRDLYGYRAALLAFAACSTCPTSLAYASMITEDATAASLGIAANYCFWKWLKNPKLGRALAAAVLLGLTWLTKFTWLILIVLWPALLMVWLLLEPRRSQRVCDTIRLAKDHFLGSTPRGRSRIAYPRWDMSHYA